MNKGFTLIELLVVILIIGILAAVALPQYQKSVIKARVIEQIELTSSIYPAVAACYLEIGDLTRCTLDDLSIETSTCHPLPGYSDCDLQVSVVTEESQGINGPRVTISNFSSSVYVYITKYPLGLVCSANGPGDYSYLCEKLGFKNSCPEGTKGTDGALTHGAGKSWDIRCL